MSQGALLDLTCGPASPLPETYQRYRLVAHLGSGGQADVYRAVRLCGGVTSAPLTVKVFRVDPKRPLVDELRSWDKGDAALMDLNNRGVGGICRRADGFYGPPPHRPGERPGAGEAVPYQIYDYLHGVNLREYVSQRAGMVAGARRLNAITALKTLATVLRSLHYPQEQGATPVLHMDIKPSNVMVLTGGEVRLIDFTGARYFREEEITQIAYTPESGGPEAFGGVKYVGPAYDVHGFGAVAYYLVTGAYPRVDGRASGPVAGDVSPPPWNVLRRHPMLENIPTLRDHLHAPLADRPSDRPDTRELPQWLAGLADLVRRSSIPDVGVDWREPEQNESARIIGRARPAVSGTETEAYQRIERLERELVELRANRAGAPVPASVGAPTGAYTQVPTGGYAQVPTGPTGGYAKVPAPATRVSNGGGGAATMVGNAPSSGAPVSGAGVAGRARVTPRPAPEPTGMMADDPAAGPPQEMWRPPRGERARQLKIGWEMSGTGAFIAFIAWGLWAISAGGKLTGPVIVFVTILAVAAGVFALSRLIGRLVIEQRLNRPRRSARGAHAIAGIFLAGAGVAYLQQVPWVMSAVHWVGGLL